LTAAAAASSKRRPIDICCSYISVSVITTTHRKYQGYYYRYSHHYVWGVIDSECEFECGKGGSGDNTSNSNSGSASSVTVSQWRRLARQQQRQQQQRKEANQCVNSMDQLFHPSAMSQKPTQSGTYCNVYRYSYCLHIEYRIVLTAASYQMRHVRTDTLLTVLYFSCHYYHTNSC
jgi:hypothetical protein